MHIREETLKPIQETYFRKDDIHNMIGAKDIDPDIIMSAAIIFAASQRGMCA